LHGRWSEHSPSRLAAELAKVGELFCVAPLS
jgi:hypothetical protein